MLISVCITVRLLAGHVREICYVERSTYNGLKCSGILSISPFKISDRELPPLLPQRTHSSNNLPHHRPHLYRPSCCPNPTCNHHQSSLRRTSIALFTLHSNHPTHFKSYHLLPICLLLLERCLRLPLLLHPPPMPQTAPVILPVVTADLALAALGIINLPRTFQGHHPDLLSLGSLGISELALVGLGIHAAMKSVQWRSQTRRCGR
jgi:hypothetical protein